MKTEKKWARLENNIVIELTDTDPAGRFHPLLIWVECPVGIPAGYIYENGKFVQPENTKLE
ncbi:hypothetical protein ACNFJN_16280 [Xenorhabdus budapestensis]|uniref:hypothetical protein n=1 Tax=Xenorhabdus budapestensis TaxID=290110 RepID=UPI003A8AC8AA